MQQNEINEITKIEVKIDNITEPVFIGRDSCTFEVLKNVFYTRKQFPHTPESEGTKIAGVLVLIREAMEINDRLPTLTATLERLVNFSEVDQNTLFIL